MANEKLQKILSMSKTMDKKGASLSKAPMAMPKQVSLQEQISKANASITAIDSEFSKPYIPTQDEMSSWNPERGRVEISELANNETFYAKLNQSKLPKAIIESMRNNPCNFEPTMVNEVMGPENAFYKKLNEAYNKGKEESVKGVKAIHKINEQLSVIDKNSEEEKAQQELMDKEKQSPMVGGIDYSLIKTIVEEAIEKKLESFGLNNLQENGIKTMAITSNGTFKFLDSEDNIYECEMRFVGKRKTNKKK